MNLIRNKYQKKWTCVAIAMKYFKNLRVPDQLLTDRINYLNISNIVTAKCNKKYKEKKFMQSITLYMVRLTNYKPIFEVV